MQLNAINKLWMLLLAGAAATANAQELVVGNLSSNSHTVGGQVVNIKDQVLKIRGFTYIGNAPDAFVWIDAGLVASDSGKILYDASQCGAQVLQAWRCETIRVEFPEGSSVSDYAGGGKRASRLFLCA